MSNPAYIDEIRSYASFEIINSGGGSGGLQPPLLVPTPASVVTFLDQTHTARCDVAIIDANISLVDNIEFSGATRPALSVAGDDSLYFYTTVTLPSTTKSLTLGRHNTPGVVDGANVKSYIVGENNYPSINNMINCLVLGCDNLPDATGLLEDTIIIGNDTGDSTLSNSNSIHIGNRTAFRRQCFGDNLLIGNQAGYNPTNMPYTIGQFNTFLGHSICAFGLNLGQNNTFLGYGTGSIEGSDNIQIGNSPSNILTFNTCIYLGHKGTAETNTMRLGYDGNLTTRTFIQGIHSVPVTGGLSVFIKSNGQMGTSNALELAIADLTSRLEALEALV